MSLKSERDLNQSNRNQYSRAKLAAQSKNYDYAISLIHAVLKDEPLFLDGRRYLRAVEIQKYEALNTFNKQMINMKIGSSAMKLSGVAKKEPAEQLLVAEEVLVMDPYHGKANATVAEAGIALGFPEFKAFAYETLAKGKPKDKTILNSLAQAYAEMKEWVKAEKTYERILEIDPRDGDALSGLKNMSAAQASKTGGWDDAKDYRDALKNTKMSEQLEQDAKVVKSADAIEESIQLNFQKHQAEPGNPIHCKAIAQLYMQKNDFAQAIDWFEAAYVAGGKIDSSLEKMIGDLRLKKAEQELQDLRATMAGLTDPEQQAQYQAAIEQKETELNRVRLSLAEARVKAQPNEGEFRYDLGDAFYRLGEYKRATEELQQSLKQPSVRYQALNKMGLSFMKRGMLDFAVKQLSLAESELAVMDDLKKEIVYNLGLAYEASKQAEKSLEQWKKIYEVDMSYRDVAARVEASYN